MKNVQEWNSIAFLLLFFSLQSGKAISLEGHQRTVTERVIANNITPPSETNVTSLRTGYIQHFGTEIQRKNIWNQTNRRIIDAGYCSSPYIWWFECVVDLASALYMHSCPEVAQTFMYEEPCPRKNWGHRTTYMYKAPYAPQTDMLEPCPRNNGKYVPTNMFSPDDDYGYWRCHYWFKNIIPNTVYDFQGTWRKEQTKSEWSRTHSCVKAKPVPLIQVVGYGLGWIYIKWPKPRENCVTKIRYTIKYYVEGFPGFTAPTKYFGAHLISWGYYTFEKFHPCPSYPNYNCMILSENIFAYRLHTIEVSYKRFAGDDEDEAGERTIKFTPDDRHMSVNFCPPTYFWNSLWFLIMLIVLLLTLMLIAAILLAILMSKKKANKLREDMAKSKIHEEEPIPGTSRFGVIWERLRNFFKELCPRPQPPPPPPPPPPRKPKKKKKKQKKQKKIVKRRIPVPPIQPPKKKERSPRTVEKRETEAIETKRAISGVGGVSGRRRR